MGSLDRCRAVLVGNGRRSPDEAMETMKHFMVVRKTADLTGKRFGRLVVCWPSGIVGGSVRWLCVCDCGQMAMTARSGQLLAGRIRSCGCRKRHKTHGQSRTKVYDAWSGMIGRCSNRKLKAWKNYGGRGIKVCARWRKFENFLFDMGFPPDGLVLDRINNDGDYKPRNCRWATYSQSNKNRR